LKIYREMWLSKENVQKLNKNLHNTIEKNREIQTYSNKLKIVQSLSETALSFEIPCFML
jgi:hypothetical protein